MSTLFREARPAPPGVHLMWTWAQSAVIWALALAVGPYALTRLEAALGVPTFAFDHQLAVGLAILVVASVLNLASGRAMALRGDGTPLPTACARRLVVAGPYAYLRNPMAVFGLAQGVGVAVALGSWLVLAYVAAGGVLWHLAIRPAEEADLEGRFGEPYRAYRRHVRCWIPRATPWVPGNA